MGNSILFLIEIIVALKPVSNVSLKSHSNSCDSQIPACAWMTKNKNYSLDELYEFRLNQLHYFYLPLDYIV